MPLAISLIKDNFIWAYPLYYSATSAIHVSCSAFVFQCDIFHHGISNGNDTTDYRIFRITSNPDVITQNKIQSY